MADHSEAKTRGRRWSATASAVPTDYIGLAVKLMPSLQNPNLCGSLPAGVVLLPAADGAPLRPALDGGAPWRCPAPLGEVGDGARVVGLEWQGDGDLGCGPLASWPGRVLGAPGCVTLGRWTDGACLLRLGAERDVASCRIAAGGLCTDTLAGGT